MSSSCANITATDPAVHCDCHNGGSRANPHLLCPETSSRCRPGDHLRSGYYHWTSSWLRATTGNDALTIRRRPMPYEASARPPLRTTDDSLPHARRGRPKRGRRSIPGLLLSLAGLPRGDVRAGARRAERAERPPAAIQTLKVVHQDWVAAEKAIGSRYAGVKDDYSGAMTRAD